jgi:hypothetical protein
MQCYSAQNARANKCIILLAISTSHVSTLVLLPAMWTLEMQFVQTAGSKLLLSPCKASSAADCTLVTIEKLSAVTSPYLHLKCRGVARL